MKVLGLQPGNARSTNGLFVGANGVFARGAGNPGVGDQGVYQNMLIIGNSFTITYPDNIIWWGTWGMAASVKENDFVHVLQTLMAPTSPNMTVNPQYCRDWEINHNNSFDYPAFFGPMLATNPDIILIRLGENVTDLTNYQADFETLINYCKSQCPNARVVVTDNYWTDAAKDQIQMAAAQATNTDFVSLQWLDNDTNNSFIGATVYGDNGAAHTVNDTAVAHHASDVGMAAIAARLFAYIVPAVNEVQAETTAYLAKTGAMLDAYENAVNNLVFDLKAASLWTKFGAIYPNAGGTAATHKWNLKDPRDLDAAFRKTYAGGWTHNLYGATANGSTGYADTHWVPATNGTLNSTHLAVYNRKNTNSAADIGMQNASGRCFMCILYSGIGYLSDHYSGTGSNRIIAGSPLPYTGLYIDTRTSANSHKAYRNSGVIGTDTNASVNFANTTNSCFVGAINDTGSAAAFSDHQYAFESLGTGLSDSDAAALVTIITNYQLAMGRGT